MLQESFFISLSFFMFVALIYKPLKRSLISILDKKISSISKYIEDSTSVRSEALLLLEKIKDQHMTAQEDAKKIVAIAEEEAKQIVLEAEQEVARITKKRIELAMQRVTQEEENIINSIKAEALEAAVARVEMMLLKELDTNSKTDMIDDSIRAVKRLLN